MKWSLKIAAVAGIGIYVHWTFLLLIGWILIAHLSAGQSTSRAFQGVGFILALFGCVVLHELGHALTAKKFGVKTRDITLLPIGGVARLESIPEDPIQEFLIAIAGPAVNIAIAVLILAGLMISGQTGLMPTQFVGGQFLLSLMWVNIGLVIFNMLPAFPMDGGRVLRALLATKMSRVQATHIAARVGQGMAILFGFAAILTGQWMLLFIALFVYLGAQGEAHAVEMRAILKGARVQDAMIKRFITLSENESLERAVNEAMSGHQKDFPVTNGQEITGLLLNKDLVEALSKGETSRRVGDLVCQACPLVREQETLDRAIDKMQRAECSALLVVREGELVGLLSAEHLGDWIMMQTALGKVRQAEISPSADRAA